MGQYDSLYKWCGGFSRLAAAGDLSVFAALVTKRRIGRRLPAFYSVILWLLHVFKGYRGVSIMNKIPSIIINAGLASGGITLPDMDLEVGEQQI